MKKSSIMIICGGVAIASAGISSWLTKVYLLKEQHRIANQFLTTAGRDAELLKGLSNSPLLLRQVYHAAGSYYGKDEAIISVALGVAILMVAFIGTDGRRKRRNNNVPSES